MKGSKRAFSNFQATPLTLRKQLRKKLPTPRFLTERTGWGNGSTPCFSYEYMNSHTKLRLLLLVLALISSFAALAGSGGDNGPRACSSQGQDNSLQVAVYPVENTEAYSITFLNKSKDRAKVEILDENTKVVYSEDVNVVKAYKRRFNMVGMKAGKYLFRISNRCDKVETLIVKS